MAVHDDVRQLAAADDAALVVDVVAQVAAYAVAVDEPAAAALAPADIALVVAAAARAPVNMLTY